MMFYHHFSLPMDRSPGFGSASSNLFALFRLAFASASDLKSLTLLENATRRSVLQKVRDCASRALSACKHRVSGSLSLPSRGSFHLSLTVLCAIGRQEVFSLGRWSSLLPAGFHVPCGTLEQTAYSFLRLRGYHPLWLAFPGVFCSDTFTFRLSSTPKTRRLSVWALSLSLAATQKIVIYFLFLRVLRCFTSPGALL